MGMYTELILKADVRRNIPTDVEAVLNTLFNNTTLTAPLPDHEFFQCARWTNIGCCCSFYHTPWSTSRYSENHIFSRSDLKNYDDEIAKFIDWVSPYLDQLHGDCIGWTWYEEDITPTLIFQKAA